VNKNVILIDPAEFGAVDNFLKNKNLVPNYILNTHHHSDHVGGNILLKQKYNCSILGFAADKDRIPGIDTFLKDKETTKIGNLEIETHHAPGHTSGHVFYYLRNEKIAFVGDIVFSLGCGRVFEGTMEQMYHSINKVKNLSPETRIFCGHEYTKSNLNFCISIDKNNKDLKIKEQIILDQRKHNIPTIPTTVMDEQKTNIFFRLDDTKIRKAISLENATELEVFSKLRKLKDNF
jgi:hydroxyacylglutathione hydrolase